MLRLLRMRMHCAALCALFALALPAAAQQSAPPPDSPAAPPDSPRPPAAPPAADAKPSAPPGGRGASPDSFESSEEISKDLSVSYPVDI